MSLLPIIEEIGSECPQVGVGGAHSDAYYDDGECCWCGAREWRFDGDVEVHVNYELPRSEWPDDDGPYWDEDRYMQAYRERPTREELESLQDFVDAHRNAGALVQTHWS